MLLRIRIILPFLCIVALAFGYRLVIMADRAAAPNDESFWDPLPAGNDQSAYIQQLKDLRSGDFPAGPFYFQPGIVYILGAVAALAGSTDLLALRLAQAALASLNCGLMALVAWQITGRLRAGLIAGALLALYPVGACYDTDFVITSQALIIATMMLGCTRLAEQRSGGLAAALCLGLLTGFGAITRFELIAPVWFAPRGCCEVAAGATCCSRWWVSQSPSRRSPLTIEPAARPTSSARRTAAALSGNNRDTAGVYGPSNASRTTKVDYLYYLLQDIALEPVRFAQLWLRKAALFLSDIEYGNIWISGGLVKACRHCFSGIASASRIWPL